MSAELDPRTPVIVGVGQVAERLDDADYRRRSPVELAADAAWVALEDCGADARACAGAIEALASTRQFEITTPAAVAPLGKSDNVPRSVAARIGADPKLAILDVAGGQSPQHLVNEFAARIAAGEFEVALAVGAEAISTAEALAHAQDKPDWTERVGGQLEDRGYGLKGISYRQFVAHGLAGGPSTYALAENARRARLGLTREQYAEEVGRLFAPFSEVAARNPFAAAPVARSAGELTRPTAANRPIADPYLRYVVAREKVNQGAAVLIMSVAAAQRLGVPSDRWVFLHGHADMRERDMLDRPDLGSYPAAVTAAGHALEVAGITVDDVASFDFYSCFPVAVFSVIDGLGVAPDDPRGLTRTGGLPFFGGPGNNYSMHGIAEIVQQVRRNPDTFGLVGANGGTLSKYSVGVYSTTPAPWRDDESARLQEELSSVAAPASAFFADGWASVETFTVAHRRDGAPTGIVIGRLERDGRRFVARNIEDDADGTEVLQVEQPIGQRVFVRSVDGINWFTTTPQRMAQLRPKPPIGLKERYEHVQVRRDGRVLEVVISRPEVRNCLHSAASQELDAVFDAYFADPELWVAIITGEGEKAFCAGADLRALGSGQTAQPNNGFAGLTNRRGMTKPVIAAVNGVALGGGFELALACHLVVADETAQFGLSEVRVGMIAGAGGIARLPRTIPPKIATELIVTGRRIEAGALKDFGVVNRIAAPGQALSVARELAEEILQCSPTSVRLSLALMNEVAVMPDVVEAAGFRSRVVDELLNSADTTEGLAAFAEKRPPRWRNQ
jgi:acetyl-CoA C-acetyltransferase